MSPTDQRPPWLQWGPLPALTGTSNTSGQLSWAWRIWEELRAWDRRYAYVVDTCIAVGLFLMASGTMLARHGPSEAIAFSAALCAPLVLRRKAPIAVFAFMAAIALWQWFVWSPLLADAALLVALYTVAASSHWVQVWAASLTVEVGVALATIRWRPVGNHVKAVVFLTGLAVTALLAGVVVRALRSQMVFLVERAQQLERERDQQATLAAAVERARIAREMHDVISHNLQVMVTLADAATSAQQANPERATEAMQEVSGTGRQALLDMRRMLGVLRDGAGTAEGVEAPALTPQPGLGELAALVERVRATGLAVTVEESGQPFVLSAAAQLTVYRIVQEALTNSMKHAQPQSVTVAIAYDDPEVAVEVTDDGAPTRHQVAAPINGSGHGVSGMAERAAAFGGTLRAGPQHGGGWQVLAVLCFCKAPIGV
jgi:signal transduction histidine kinase